jgi:hypothetical protein
MHDSRRSGAAFVGLGILLLIFGASVLPYKGWMFLGAALLLAAPLVLAVGIVRLLLPSTRAPKGFHSATPKRRVRDDNDG